MTATRLVYRSLSDFGYYKILIPKGGGMMPTITKEADYVTLINYFNVNPEDKDELARLELEESIQYSDEREGEMAAIVHRSLSGDRVFDYAQWRSQAAIEKFTQSDAFQQHLERVSHLDFQSDPRPYEVVETISDGEAAEISDQALAQTTAQGMIVTLTMIWVQSGAQLGVVEQLSEKMRGLRAQKPEHMVSSYLLSSSDGERVAVYTQWQSKTAAEEEPFGLSTGQKLAE